jgi:hypothetical protein
MPNTLLLTVATLALITHKPHGAGVGAGERQRGATIVRANPAERLNIAQFYFEDELDTVYGRELERLDEVCRNLQERQPCRVKNLRPYSKVVTVVHRGPSEASEIVGELMAVLGFHPEDGLVYRLEFRPRDPRGKPGVWLESVGDWGYGIEIPGVRITGNWIQLFGSPLPAESWVNGRSTTFLALEEGSIQGSLVSLPALPATFDGTRRLIMPGSYLIERIRGSQITLRQQVASDFPCGEDVKPPAVMPPSLETRAQDLFSATGFPLFSQTYSRGC